MRLTCFSAPTAVWLAFAFILTVAAQIFCWPHVTDDAYFTFRCVLNLLAGYGPVFNPPERVEVFSNPLWLYLLALLKWVSGADLVLLAKLVGLACSTATVWAIIRFFRFFPLQDRASTAAFALIWLALTPGFQVYATLGLEVPLLTFLLTLGATQSAIALSREQRNDQLAGQKPAALCFALACLCRPEGPFYAALWGILLALWLLKNPDHRQQTLKQLVQLGAITTLPFLCYLCFRYQYYGALLPNTAIAKPTNVFGFSFFETEIRTWLAPLAGLVILILYARPQIRLHSGLLLPLVVPLTGPILAGFIFYIYAGSDWMLFSRFLLPVLPLLFILVSVLFETSAKAPQKHPLALTLFFLVLAGNAVYVGSPYVRNQGLASMLMRGTDEIVIGQWIERNFPPYITLVGRRTGIIGYYTRSKKVRDLFGLTDYEQAMYLRNAGTAMALNLDDQNPLLNKNGGPEILMLTRPPIPTEKDRYTSEEKNFLQARDYRCVQSFPQGNWGTYDIWARSGLMPEIPEQDCLSHGAQP